ncbi:PIN-like domain-containing protein [Cohnella silvisoli]|uniref:PIN domain-containing protein n=1 Tax=Cohnella silvisoli TaxID=2873699 RepID=A0ABV1L3H5_9BACL|nr:PIN-like domain-containing protein [Cohnella silvisoli]MCD9025879.1 PIN domain-containing protein [Cohnella silvisoli]
MKSLFSMYYTPTDDDFNRLWEESVIVFDANVLLNLYRYTIKTKDIFMDIIRELSSRIWIPHQAALEFHANRLKVIYEQVDAYQQVRKILNDAAGPLTLQLNDGLKDYARKHPIIDVNNIKERINGFFELLNKEVNEQENLHPNYLQNDDVREFLERHITSIGPPFTKDQLEVVFREGEIRYKLKRPPGFRDASDKKDDRKYYQGLTIESQYGDLLIWKQIIEEAKIRKKSVILVTDDVKDDWWLRVHGKTIGPRFELIDEFTYETDQNFYMYESHRFLEFAQKYLDHTVDEEAVQEVQDLKEFKEMMLNEDERIKTRARELNSKQKRLFSLSNLPLVKNEKREENRIFIISFAPKRDFDIFDYRDRISSEIMKTGRFVELIKVKQWEIPGDLGPQEIHVSISIYDPEGDASIEFMISIFSKIFKSHNFTIDELT